MSDSMRTDGVWAENCGGLGKRKRREAEMSIDKAERLLLIQVADNLHNTYKNFLETGNIDELSPAVIGAVNRLWRLGGSERQLPLRKFPDGKPTDIEDLPKGTYAFGQKRKQVEVPK